jgi:putative pyruvate formate lyase activating enzyme
VLDDQGIARRGLLVRHLVLPHGIAGTEAVLTFLAEEISPDTYVNLMDQYRSWYRAGELPELSARLRRPSMRKPWSYPSLRLWRFDQRRVFRSW